MRQRLLTAIAAIPIAQLLAVPIVHAQPFVPLETCVGDANDDATVSVDEVIRAVAIALGDEPDFSFRSSEQVAFLVGLSLPSPLGSTGQCMGDCDGDGATSVNDLVLSLGIALGRGEVALCPAGDLDGDGAIAIDELVRAVGAALARCAAPTPSGTPTDTATQDPADTPTETPTVTPTEEPTVTPTAPGEPFFRDVTAQARLQFEHDYTGYLDVGNRELAMTMGGVAAGDYDGDGWVDLYFVVGDTNSNRMYRNRQDGTFSLVFPGTSVFGARGCGPTFVDYDGDGWLDLFVGGVEGTPPQVFRNLGNGTFDDVSESTEITRQSELEQNISAAFGDYDRDGDLDMVLAHWGTRPTPAETLAYLWENDGDGTFSGESIGPLPEGYFDTTFTPNFADIDSDGWPDILLAADFGNSRVVLNNRDGTFRDATTDVISDENGMGAAVGDYDNDGDLDWFVTSIFDDATTPGARWGLSGNRLYRNRGDGTFEDATDEAGVREGGWGWGACFADFNNDGFLDIFHVNGWGRLDVATGGFFLDVAAPFHFDRSRLFLANGDGTFTERSAALGIDDTGQGRGVVCFDYDRDGDIDLLVANNGGAPRLFRNEGGNRMSFLQVKLRGRAPNSEAIGGRVYVTEGDRTQLREIRNGSNFESQDPAVAHFGLGTASSVAQVRVIWPDGQTSLLQDVPADQFLVVDEP
jgi:hypothetical protein